MTDSCLQVLWCDMAGFEVLKVGQFGNAVEIANLGKETDHWVRWPRYFESTVDGAGTVDKK